GIFCSVRPCECVRQGSLGSGVVWLQFHCLLQVGNGFISQSFLQERDSQVVLRARVVWRQPRAFSVMDESLIYSPLSQQLRTEVLVGHLVIFGGSQCVAK